jgi:dTDP-4-dehydrorhamnose reductase
MLAYDFTHIALSHGYDVIVCGIAECDITDICSIQSVLDHHHPDVVINCAAYTAVDQAQ